VAVNLTKATQNCISCWGDPLDVHSVKQKCTTYSQKTCVFKDLNKESTTSLLSTT